MFEFGQLKYIFIYNSQTLKRGSEYYYRGAIKEAKLGHNFFTDGFEVNALVQGSSLYKTRIIFNQYHEYEGCNCSCAAYSERRVPCKHIAALYVFLNNSEEFKKSVNYMAADDFMDIYYKRIPNENKFYLNVQYFIEPLSYSGKAFGSISMRIGLDKLYIVRNIRSFMNQLDTPDTVEFGKKFIYNPRIHQFKDEDKKIIEFFKEINTIERLTDGEKYHGGRNVYSTKSFDVDDILLNKFLKLLDGRPFGFYVKDKWVEGVTAEFDIKPFNIDINAKEENIIAKINFNSDYKVFYRWDNIIYSEGKLYLMDKNDSSYMFFKVMRDRKVDTMEFRGKQKDRFVSVIPRILEKENVRVSPHITQSFVKVPLKTNIYIDKYNLGIAIKIEFIYGDYKMDPIHKEEVNPFIVRDYESEERIMNIIEDSGFKVNDAAVYIEDDDRIYMFFKQMLPVLNPYCNIYYTDDVRNLYRGSIKSYSGYTHTRPEASMIDINFKIDEIDPVEIREVLKSIKERKKYHKLRDGSILSLEDDKIEELSKFLGEVEEDEIKNNIISLSKYRAVNVVQSLGEYCFNGIENFERIEKIIRKIKDYNSDKIEIPQNFMGILRDYQSTGYKWMKTLSDVGLCGILADDMGLGKTLQAIVLIYGNNGKPSIIIAPSSLIFNWENEIKRFAPDITTLVVAGGKSIREEMLQSISDYDAIITSYPLLRRDIEFYKDIVFEYCIIDEAQHIKNPESINAHCVKSIHAEKRFALTGTPMENSLVELWSIFDFLMPGYLFSRNKFMEKFERPIVRDNDKRKLESLTRSISPFILRRKKKDVLTELPDKIETKLVCKLSDEQMKIYRAYLFKTRSEIEKIIENEGFENSRMHILAALTRLRQICCHPSVFIEGYEGGSAKMDLLEEMLNELLEGQHRILLFSQFTSLLEIIKKLLNDKKIKYKFLDGSTPVYERMGLVKSFNSGEGDVFLISLKAGGTGLNLTSADTVIHFDPWWNPAVEDQASDRAHRIGQRNVVQVFKLITKDTIEEKIFELQQKKKDLINAVIQEGETIISKLSEDELLELLKI